MHVAAYRAVSSRLQAVDPPVCVVEFGSKNINGSVRPLFRGAAFTGVDVVAGPDVDVVADAASFTPEVAPDCVVCCEVLEHAENAQAIIKNAVRILRPGGLVIVTCASDGRQPHSAVDGGALREGEFYRNVPPSLLASWLADAGAVGEVEHSADNGDVYASARKVQKHG